MLTETFLSESDTLVARADHLPFSRVDDAIIAVDRESGMCYALNSTSARVWELIESPVAIDELCDSLLREFDVEPDVCRTDVLSILSDMKQNGMLRVSVR